MNSTNNEKKVPTPLFISMWLAVAGTLIFIFAYFLKFYSSNISGDPNDWANFGSYIGGSLGGLLSLIALIAVYYTYVSQTDSSVEQKQNLLDTLETLRQQNNEMTKQTKSLSKQVDVQDAQRVSAENYYKEQLIISIGQHENTKNYYDEQLKISTAQQISAEKQLLESRSHLLIGNLIETINSISAEHEYSGVVSGHRYFDGLRDMLRSSLINAANGEPERTLIDIYKEQRPHSLDSHEANWETVRGQIKTILSLVESDRGSFTFIANSLQNQLSSGIAFLLAVDCALYDLRIKEILEQNGLLLYTINDKDLLSALGYSDSAFNLN